MGRYLAWLAAAAVLATGVAAKAIPPPWTLEAAKAKADLIVTAKTARSAVVKDDGQGFFRDMKIALEPIEVLKGKLPAKDGKTLPPVLLYRERRQQPAGGLVRVAIGGTGPAKPGDGETAILFLRKDPKGGPEHFRVVCGSFGYVKLDAATKEDLAAITKRIDWYRKFCEKVQDAKLRKAMLGYYDKAVELAKRRQAAKAAGWRAVAGDSRAYRDAKAKERLLRGRFVVKNYGKPGVAYLRPPQDYYLKVGAREVRLGPAPSFDSLADDLSGKTVEVKGKTRPLSAGSKETFLLVGWLREVADPKPPKPVPPPPNPLPPQAPKRL